MFNLNRKNIYKEDGYAFSFDYVKNTAGANHKRIILPIWQNLRFSNFTVCFDFLSKNISLNQSGVIWGFRWGSGNGFAYLQIFKNSGNCQLRYVVRKTVGFVDIRINITQEVLYRFIMSVDSTGSVVNIYLNGNKTSTAVDVTQSELGTPINRHEIGLALDANSIEPACKVANFLLLNKAVNDAEAHFITYSKDIESIDTLESNVILRYKLNQLNGIILAEKEKETFAIVFNREDISKQILQNGNAWQPII